MIVAPSAWKVILAVALLATIVTSARARAPRRAVPGADLRRLVAAALTLYLVGALAWLTHHLELAVLVYAAGITVAALAAWLSRGVDAGGPPGGEELPVDDQPPPDPEGLRFDWDAFERQ